MPLGSSPPAYSPASLSSSRTLDRLTGAEPCRITRQARPATARRAARAASGGLHEQAGTRQKIAKDAELSKSSAAAAVDSFFDGVTKALKKGDSITFVGFGTFKTSQRKARTARNPQTGAPIKIKARRVVALHRRQGPEEHRQVAPQACAVVPRRCSPARDGRARVARLDAGLSSADPRTSCAVDASSDRIVILSVRRNAR